MTMKTKQVEVFLLHSVARGGEIICNTDMSKGLFAAAYTLLGSGIATINLLPLDADADEGVEI